MLVINVYCFEWLLHVLSARIAAYTGLQVDIDRIRSDNNEKSDVERKSGLIIRSGKNPTKEMRDQWQKDAQERCGRHRGYMLQIISQHAG